MNEKQQKVRKFYKEFLSWKANNIGIWIGAGILEIFFVMMMMIPYEEIQKDRGFLVLPMMFGFFAAMLYVLPYMTFSEEQKTVSIYEKLKYLPIDYGEIRKMRVIYLAKFVAKGFLVVFFFQLLFSYLAFGRITLGGMGYVVLVGLVWPLVSNLPYVYWGK